MDPITIEHRDLIAFCDTYTVVSGYVPGLRSEYFEDSVSDTLCTDPADAIQIAKATHVTPSSPFWMSECQPVAIKAYLLELVVFAEEVDNADRVFIGEYDRSNFKLVEVLPGFVR